MEVRLVAIPPFEYDDFFAVFEAYLRELDAYDPAAEGFDIGRYRAATLADMEGRELLWIVAGGERAGFAVVRTLPDWPDETRQIAEIIEFYVAPEQRRRGVGRAAVKTLLADHRRRGTHLVEAGILRDNAPAHAFWAALGFEVQAIRTARRP